jgi:membrane-bound lytic murein transglycosylase D
MKKSIVLVFALMVTAGAGATSLKDSLPQGGKYQLNPDDPEIAEIDRILVSSYLNHYCYSTDQCFLNAYGYSPEAVPAFAADVVSSRMDILDRNTPFDLVYNSTVQGFIDLYAVRRRDISTKVLGISELYFPMIEEYLAKYEIPLEMKYLAIVESALNPTAISHAGAGGLWQFMVSTGKMYGLEVTSYQDDRFDAYKSTEAACRYLKFLYKTFGDWQLALAAYNSGPGNVNKAIRRSGGKRDFWSIKPFLPKETQGYVPAFIAVNYVMNHASEYNIYPKKPIASFFEVDTVGVNKRVDFGTLSKVIDMSVEDISFLNGTYKLKEIPMNGDRHYIVLPVSKVGLFMANEETIYAQSEIKKHEPEPVLSASQESVPEGKVAKTTWETGWKTHKVRKGESLGSIADKYDVSLAELRKWNKIKSTKIVAGQSLKVQTKVKKTVYVNDENYTSNKQPEKVQTAEVKPAQESSEEENYQEEAKAEVKDVAVTKPVKSAKPQYKYYVVQKGDTLSKIANSKGVSVDQIKDLNSGLKENKLAIGQKIKIKQI